MRAQDLIGQTICDTYVGVRILGSGTMGTVLEVRHVRLPKRFALKLLHSDLGEGAEVYARFRREAEIASSLGHPNIVNVVDWNRLPDGTPFLVMEYLVGEDLASRMQRLGALPLPAVLELARQVGAALSAAHKHGVVHRDLKPQNIFLCQEDRGEEEVEVAKVLDFGISKILGTEGTYTGAMRVMGTPLYMAPEQAMGLAANVDGRADQFALGAILYHALSGRRPFDGATVVEIALKVMSEDPVPLRELVSGLPPEVDEAIRRALSKEREARFATMGDFVRALGAGPRATGLTGSSPTGSGSGGLRRADPSGAVLLPSAQTPLRAPSATGPLEVESLLVRPPLFGGDAGARWRLVAIGLLSALLSFALVRAAAPRRTPPPAAVTEVPPPPPPVVRPPAVPRVTLRFVVQPPTAEIYLDGKRVDNVVEVPRSELGLRLEVKAPGYIQQTDVVVPSGDQRVLIRLVPRRRAAPAPAQAPF